MSAFAPAPPVPCQIIAGPLGVGKTTTILRYVRRHAGRKRVGVLVNDFGDQGVDAALFRHDAQTANDLDVVSIPGGCLCCTSSAHFDEGLERLMQRGPFDRILIEPSGIVFLAALKQDLQRLSARLPIRLAPTVTLLSLTRVTERHYRTRPFYTQLIDEADHLVATGADRATPEHATAFRLWADALTPAKAGVWITSHGSLPDVVFDGATPAVKPVHARSTAPAPAHAGLQKHRWQHDAHHPIDLSALMAYLRDVDTVPGRRGLLRLKGLVHSTQGWALVQWTQEHLELRPFPAQSQSYIEWITRASDANPLIRRCLESGVQEEAYPAWN